MLSIPTRCETCDRYCDGCSLSKVYQTDPLDAARGILFGLLLSVAAWSLFAGLLLACYYGGLL